MPADDDSRRPRPEPAHVVLARAQAAEAERSRRARAPKAQTGSRALTVKDEPAKEEPSQALVAIDNEAKAKRDAERKEERRLKKEQRDLFEPDVRARRRCTAPSSRATLRN